MVCDARWWLVAFVVLDFGLINNLVLRPEEIKQEYGDNRDDAHECDLGTDSSGRQRPRVVNVTEDLVCSALDTRHGAGE